MEWTIGFARTVEKQSQHCNDDQEMGTKLKNWITLDNGPTLSLFRILTYWRIYKLQTRLSYTCNNAGVKHSNQEAVIAWFVKVYFDKDAIAKYSP